MPGQGVAERSLRAHPVGRVLTHGVRLAYEITGDGEPVLLLGGSGMSPASWRVTALSALATQGYRVVTFAGRGVAPSDQPPGPYTVPELAADAAGLIESLDLAPCRLVGYSLGSFVAEELARMRPDLVRAVVLVAGAGRGTEYAKARYRAERDAHMAGRKPSDAAAAVDAVTIHLAAHELQNCDERVRTWLALLGPGTPKDGPGQLAATWSWALDNDDVSRYERLAVPCLVVAFEHDLLFPPRTCREAARLAPRARFAEIRGAGHGGVFTAAPALAEVVLDFLALT